MTDLIQIVILSLVAISCGMVGPFLVLKRMTMFANSLSHTILLGIALAFLISGAAVFSLPTLLLGAFFAAVMTALLTEMCVRLLRLQEDASVGLVFSALFALGICVVTLYMKDVHLGLEAVMGNVDLLQWSDAVVTGSATLLSAGTIALFYRRLQLICFDEGLAKSFGISRGVFHFLLLFLTAIVCVGAFRAVGVLLVLAFLTGPFLTARLFSHSLPRLLLYSPLIGIAASILGVCFSRLCFEVWGLALSTAGCVSTILGLIYVCSWKINRRFA